MTPETVTADDGPVIINPRTMDVSAEHVAMRLISSELSAEDRDFVRRSVESVYDGWVRFHFSDDLDHLMRGSNDAPQS